MGKLREIKSIAVLFGIMSIVLGIVLVVIPGQTQLIINTIVGVALLVVGLIGIFGFASLKKKSNHSGAMVILPVVIAILGLFVLYESNCDFWRYTPCICDTYGMECVCNDDSDSHDSRHISNSKRRDDARSELNSEQC